MCSKPLKGQPGFSDGSDATILVFLDVFCKSYDEVDQTIATSK